MAWRRRWPNTWPTAEHRLENPDEAEPEEAGDNGYNIMHRAGAESPLKRRRSCAKPPSKRSATCAPSAGRPRWSTRRAAASAMPAGIASASGCGNATTATPRPIPLLVHPVILKERTFDRRISPPALPRLPVPLKKTKTARRSSTSAVSSFPSASAVL